MLFTPVSFVEIETLPQAIVDPEHQRLLAALFQKHATKTAERAVELHKIQIGEFWKYVFGNLSFAMYTLKDLEESAPTWMLRAYACQLLHSHFKTISSVTHRQALMCRPDSIIPMRMRSRIQKIEQRYVDFMMREIQEIQDATSDIDIFTKQKLTSTASS